MIFSSMGLCRACSVSLVEFDVLIYRFSRRTFFDADFEILLFLEWIEIDFSS